MEKSNAIALGLSRTVAAVLGSLLRVSRRDTASVRGIWRSYMFPSPPVPIRFSQYLKLTRVGFGVWFLMRRAMHAFRSPRIEKAAAEQTAQGTIEHNLDGVWRITRQRSERLIGVLKNVRAVDRHSAKVLVIGPRNEAELLLMAGHGFDLGNILAIDLISVCPAIKVMDMHAMSFPDNTFDIVYASYVLTYSNAPSKAVSEMLRVLKPGGILAVAWGLDFKKDENVVGTQSMRGQLDEMRGYLGRSEGHVYWQEAHRTGTSVACSMIVQSAKA